MKVTDSKRISPKTSISIIALATIGILLIPLIAMQFTDEVAWTGTDFIVAGALLLGGGLSYELLARKVKTRERQIALVLTLVALVAFIWVELAVGIFSGWRS